MTAWTIISRLGSFNVTTALALFIAIWLIAARANRAAASWCLLFSASSALVIATKVAFIGWGAGSASLDFTGISGHAARATAAFPVLSYLMLQRARPALRVGGVVLGLCFGVAVGISRIALHAHSPSEAAAGCALGALVSLAFIRMCGPLRERAMLQSLALAGLVLLLAAFGAPAAPTQHWMTTLALQLSDHQRPYIRYGWKLAPPGWPHRTPLAGPESGVDASVKPDAAPGEPASGCCVRNLIAPSTPASSPFDQPHRKGATNG